MSLEYIRRHYGVPAYPDTLVDFHWPEGATRTGKIVGARDAHLLVDFPDQPWSLRIHPTWRVTYHAHCDGSVECPADLHRSSCYGLYRTEQEVADGVIPEMAELQRRRAQEQNLRRVVAVDRARNYGIGEVQP